MKINFDQLVKVKRINSHLEGYNKPCLNINYEHYTKVLKAKENALKTN
jgi:hypothetical protein